MLKVNVHVILRLVAGAAIAIAFAVSPQLAQAQTPGALTQLTSPNNCIELTALESDECQTTAPGLNGSDDTVVSPDGKHVYVSSPNDDAIAEFSRNADGSLSEIGCIADQTSEGSCDNTSASGLVEPSAIAISPDGKNVYVAARDDEDDGTISEFTVNADGSLTPVPNNDCIAENENDVCPVQGAHGLGSDEAPDALAVSPNGDTVYVGDFEDQAVTTLTRNTADGSLTEPGGADDCIQDADEDSDECSNTANGLSDVTGVAVSPHGDNVYTSGSPSEFSSSSIAEFARGDDGVLTQLDAPNNCLGDPEDDETCGGDVNGLFGTIGLVISPDGNNVYTASEGEAGPIAEFSRGADGALAQLASPNDCIQEQTGEDFGCGTTTGTGIGNGFRLVVSPDGANVYASAPSASEENPCQADSCQDVAEFARSGDGSLSQLPAPDSCIQDAGAEGSECAGNENGTGLGGPGLAISPDGNNVYVTGEDSIAEFARGTHTLTVSAAGSGSGAVSDGTGAIACPSTCSHAYTANTPVTLTATPASGSTFTGWSGTCSGTGTCQVTMSGDMAVTATFTASATPTPGQPTPVVTGAPTAVTDAGAGFSGSVNPEGLPTTVFFQYGLDKGYSQVGASGPNYTQQTTGQSVGADFATHGIGPATVSGLVPNALYHVRLVATNSAGTAFGQDVTFKTALAPAPPAATLGQTFNIAPVAGLVLVLIHGHLVPLTQLEQLPLGVVIDSLHGTFKVVTSAGSGGTASDAAAKGNGGKTQTGSFGGAVVRLHQTKGGPNSGLTTVMMVLGAFKGAPSQSLCNTGAAGDAHAATASKTLQLLHSSAKGKFRTSGRYAAATVRGTKWTIAARCDGTSVRDVTDSVAVSDFVRHKTIILHAGQSYLAPGPRKRP
jgi:DNA-binding beta-propeller fold protein YncE